MHVHFGGIQWLACRAISACAELLVILQVTVYHMLKLFQTEADIMLGKKNLVSEFYDELVCGILCISMRSSCTCSQEYILTGLCYIVTGRS